MPPTNPPNGAIIRFKQEIPPGIAEAIVEARSLIMAGEGTISYDPSHRQYVLHLRLDEVVKPVNNGFLRGMREVWLLSPSNMRTSNEA